MVQNIRGIHPELQRLRFRDPDRLAHRRIELPLSRQFQCFLTESSAMLRLRVQKTNLIRLGVGYRLQRTVWLKFCGDLTTLRIWNLRKAGAELISRVAIPLHTTKRLHRKRSDDIR